MVSDSTAAYLDGPDYDETTDPATLEAMQDADELGPADPYLYRGDAEKTAQRLAFSTPGSRTQDEFAALVKRKVEEDAELDREALAELDPFHGNSGPGGPLHVCDDAPNLASVLREIEHHDTDYDVRYGLVLTAVAIAHADGYPAGFALDLAEPDWPVAYIELPTGQVSWHMPAHFRLWDGHTTDQKYERIRAFCDMED